MFFINMCENPDILRVLYFGLKILKFVYLLIPIGLIVFITIDVFKMVVANSDNDVKKSLKTVTNRIIFAVLLFFVPTIVTAIMNLLGNANINADLVSCLNNANKEKIERLTIEVAELALEDAEIELTTYSIQKAKIAIKKIKDKNIKAQLNARVSVLKAENNNSNSTENEKPSQSETNYDNNFTNYGNGTGGKYYAPIQKHTGSIKFSKKSYTAGCSNNVYHDLSGVSEGTPIYAGIDGTATFYQSYCASNNQLYSYGNIVSIKANDGTVIKYAHLQKFPENVISKSTSNTYITETCPKKGDNAPCPSTSCSSGIMRNTIARLEVKKGDLIGYLGNTGNSTAPHLHIEIKENGSSNCVENPWKAFGMQY